MTSAQIKKAVKKWATKIGHKEAMRRLVNNAEISVAVTQKLVSGGYESELSFDKAQSILKELAKDGISLAGEVAS